MLDWNNNGGRDAFDMAMDMMVLDEFEREEREARLENDLLDTGYDRDDLTWMDSDKRYEEELLNVAEPKAEYKTKKE